MTLFKIFFYYCFQKLKIVLILQHEKLSEIIEMFERILLQSNIRILALEKYTSIARFRVFSLHYIYYIDCILCGYFSERLKIIVRSGERLGGDSGARLYTTDGNDKTIFAVGKIGTIFAVPTPKPTQFVVYIITIIVIICIIGRVHGETIGPKRTMSRVHTAHNN